ncbi:MAG: SdpI family protein [Candidatus Buchananbacteria bacterium]|nr:SdpI family protein [Candidatus Buchananbacteria bacterium]
MSSPIKPTLKSEIIPIALLVLAIAASFYFYAYFPEQVPSHWNFQGEIDSYSSRGFAAFFFPALNVVIYLLFLAIPYLDPKKDRYQEFTKAYHVFKNLIVAFMTIIYFFIGVAGLGYQVPITLLVPSLVGILFIVIGNYLSKIKTNWFMGIRTPWTISNDEVWNKTNRLGGKLFVAFGALMILGIFLPQEIFWQIFMICTAVVVIVPIVYSYFLYRKISQK